MKYYTVEEIAERLGRHPRTVRDWIKTGCKTNGGHVRLEAIKIGRWWSIPEEEFVLFQYRLKTQPATRPNLELEEEKGKG